MAILLKKQVILLKKFVMLPKKTLILKKNDSIEVSIARNVSPMCFGSKKEAKKVRLPQEVVICEGVDGLNGRTVSCCVMSCHVVSCLVLSCVVFAIVCCLLLSGTVSYVELS